MNDYISREDAIDCVLNQYCASSDETEKALGDAIEEIKKRSAADVVEVIRCKDCKYYNPHGSFNCSKNLIDMHPYGFCSRGERETYNE